ncbi:conserved protein [Methanothermobacter thermautotrophicus str. Delta H]|uniref:Conserved protein n=1 Tax=Methanothermobacter thermautotrophicus (strain ATCC 29096 / DSM 1053 / JCM 10044 / NBRC 100330 / Delta H) TaxID=187420 RepID=O26440_METTH|nr:conserved protein [Methanothermobacter thermautotrophicus str. Delta H]BAZ98384.1 hypothetical protein tca_00309 [Methanothermobacter sp. EMTCatA1]
MVKFLVLGVNKDNKGNEALVKSTVATIKSLIENCNFVFVGVRNEKIKVDNSYYSVLENPTYEMSLKKPLMVLGSLFLLLKIFLFKRLKMEMKFENNIILKNIQEADVLINTGGDHLSGEYGRSIIITLVNLLYAILLDKPVVLYSESLGYPKNRCLGFLLNYVLERSSLILVREPKSYEYLQNSLKSKNYYLTADSAFLLNPSSRNQKNENDNHVIGFNVSPLITNFAKSLDILKLSIDTIDFLLKNKNVNVLLVPHVYGEDSDLKILSKIYEHFDSERLLLIDKEYDAEELKSIIGQCDLFIGARMHATIAATSMFVPTVGIAYSHKMHGIIGEMLGLEDYIIDIEDLNSEILIEKTLKAWENREEIQDHLRKVIPEVKMKAWKNGELVKELCDSLGIS